LKRLKGKVVFVDIWASWCQPCIKEMPFSKNLQESYKNENIVFLYLSKDTDFEMWKKSSQKYELNNNENNYKIANQFVSRQFEELNIEYIPRYLLYDKNGNLVQDYAPRPSDNKLIILLDKYLGE